MLGFISIFHFFCNRLPSEEKQILKMKKKKQKTGEPCILCYLKELYYFQVTIIYQSVLISYIFYLQFSARIVPSRYMETAKAPKKLPVKVNVSTSEQSKVYFVRTVSQ